MLRDRIFSVIALAVALLFLVGALGIVPFEQLTITSPGGYPILIAVLCVIFGGLSMVETFQKKKETGGENFRVFDPVIIAFILLLSLYVVAIIYLHYALATLLFLFAALLFLKRGKWGQAFLISYIGTFMVMLIFKYMFNVIMP